MQYLAIREWGAYQHYRDRSPPWIKLHRSLLTSPTWVSMDDANRVLAVAIMLLAAATDNRIMADATYIQRVAYLNKRPDWSKLVAIGFLEIIDENGAASTNLADASSPHTNALPEGETEQRQSRAEDNGKRAKPKVRLDPTWQPSVEDRAIAESLGHNPDEITPEFVDWNIANGILSTNWSLNFRNRCRQLARYRDNRAGGVRGMAHRQGPNSLIAAARAVAAQIEGEQ